MSSAVSEPPAIETFEPQADSPKIAVDPMMAAGASSAAGPKFSDISELPPLKEVYVAPPPPPPPVDLHPEASPVSVFSARQEEEKPKIQPAELAQKAIKEIANVPPKLYLYALAGAVGIILLIGLAVMIYVHHQNSEDDSGAKRAPATLESPVPAQAAQPAVSQPAQPAPDTTQSADTQEIASPVHAGAKSKSHNAKKPVAEPEPVVLPGLLAVDSNPPGAQVQVDGKSDPSWVTPFSFTNLQPGQHSIVVSKAGYSTDSRTIDVAAGARATATVHLAQLMATLVVKSDPPGASIYVDGKDMRTKTPGQLSVDKGSHVVLVRMPGFIDETMNGQFTLGQTFSFAPTLRALGNADSVKPVGKMSKLFGGKGTQPGQATLSIRTQPKGAQIAVNQRLLEKNSPVELALDPGNYVVDITLSGYVPVHKVVNAEKGGKLVVDESLKKQ